MLVFYVCSHAAFAARPTYPVIQSLWMVPALAKNHCFSSLLGPTNKENNCVSWVRQERAGPLYNPYLKVIYAAGTDGYMRVFGAKKGELLLSSPLGSEIVAQPLLTHRGLYVGTLSGQLFHLNPFNLQTLWATALDSEIQSPCVAHKNMVYVLTGAATIYALDAEKGHIIWMKKRPFASSLYLRIEAVPLILPFSQKNRGLDMLVVGHPTGRVDFLEADTGKVIREIVLASAQENRFPDVVAEPVFADNVVVVASYQLGLKAFDPFTGVKKWELPESGLTKLLVSGKTLLAAGPQKVLAIDLDTKHTKWRFLFSKGNPSRMIAKNNNLYFASDADALYVLSLNTGEPLQYFGSGLGFAPDLAFAPDRFFAMSTAGYLFGLSSDSKRGFIHAQ